MKVFKIVLLGLMLSLSSMSKAQVSINVNIGTPPVWAPPAAPPECRYYYMPDIQTYYDVRREVFLCNGPRGWYSTRVLPEIYANFDLYHGCKVVLDFRGDNPYRYYDVHRVRYPRGYVVHYDKPYKIKHDNGNHYGHYKNGKSKSREVIYVNGYRDGGYDGRRHGSNDDHDDDDQGHGRGNGHGKGRRG